MEHTVHSGYALLHERHWDSWSRGYVTCQWTQPFSVRKPRWQPLGLVCSPSIVPSQNSMRDHCDIISWYHDHLLWSSGRKTTAHVHRKHCSSSAHLPTSMPESPVAIDTSKPLCLFLNPNFVPVTLSPRYFGVPSYWSLNLFTSPTTKHSRFNK